MSDRQDRFGKKIKRENGKSPTRIHATTQIANNTPFNKRYDKYFFEFLMIFCGSLFDRILPYPWSLIADLVAIGGFFILFGRWLYHNIWRKYYRVKNPADIYFWTPKKSDYQLDYIEQDEDEHLLEQLTLPPNSEKVIFLSIKPKLDIVVNELSFGCEGKKDDKPEPCMYFNQFVHRGINEKSPDTDHRHYVDSNLHYHMEEWNKVFIKGITIIHGFKIKTKNKGDYPFKIRFLTIEGEGQANLKIHVE